MEDPLNISIPLSEVETSLPLLPEADYPLQIVESTVEANKDKTGFNWNMKLITTSPITAVDGREVKPGFPVFVNNLALQAKADSTDSEAFKRGLSEAVDAIFGTTKGNRPEFSRDVVTSAIGKTVTAHVYVDDWQGVSRNKVRRLKKA